MKAIKHVFIPILFFLGGIVSVFMLLHKILGEICKYTDTITIFKDYIIETLDQLFFGRPRHPRTPQADTGYRPKYKSYTTYYKEGKDDI